jgi:hypothetical protein
VFDVLVLVPINFAIVHDLCKWLKGKSRDIFFYYNCKNFHALEKALTTYILLLHND